MLVRVINKVCKHCGGSFRASCGKEEFCTDQCKIHSNVAIDADSGCWNWQRSKDEDGYGYMKAKGHKTVKVHRAAYRLFKGEIPAGLLICHTCDNPLCCNPDHLFAGTAKQNKQDCMTKRRDMSARGTAHHKNKLTEADVLAIIASADPAPRLAERYGVHRNTIYGIRDGEIWKHLERNGQPLR